jgi:putative transposase
VRNEKALLLALMEVGRWRESPPGRPRKWPKSSAEPPSPRASSPRWLALDSELSAWRNRRLEAEAYPYLFVDARYEKVRVDGRVVSQGVLVVSGVREDGFREILAVEVANTESEAPTRTSSGPRSDEGFREWSWWSQMTTKAWKPP